MRFLLSTLLAVSVCLTSTPLISSIHIHQLATLSQHHDMTHTDASYVSDTVDVAMMAPKKPLLEDAPNEAWDAQTALKEAVPEDNNIPDKGKDADQFAFYSKSNEGDKISFIQLNTQQQQQQQHRIKQTLKTRLANHDKQLVQVTVKNVGQQIKFAKQAGGQSTATLGACLQRRRQIAGKPLWTRNDGGLSTEHRDGRVGDKVTTGAFFHDYKGVVREYVYTDDSDYVRFEYVLGFSCNCLGNVVSGNGGAHGWANLDTFLNSLNGAGEHKVYTIGCKSNRVEGLITSASRRTMSFGPDDKGVNSWWGYFEDADRDAGRRESRPYIDVPLETQQGDSGAGLYYISPAGGPHRLIGILKSKIGVRSQFTPIWNIKIPANYAVC